MRNHASEVAVVAALLVATLVAGCATRSRVAEVEAEKARPAEEALPPTEEEVRAEEIRQIVVETRRVEEDLEKVEVMAPRLASVPALESHAVAEAAGGAGERQGAIELTDPALQEAEDVGQPARGLLPLETVYVVDDLSFRPGQSTLTPRSRWVLDRLAERLLLENVGFYLEAWGYGDGGSSGEHDLWLGRARAEAVRRHLHLEGGIPLHHIKAISPGPTPPVPLAAPHAAAEPPRGRVVVVVLR